MIIKKQYMRDEKRNKIGVMIAIQDGNKMYLGFSKCNMSMDQFDKTIGTQMAIGRARKYNDSSFEKIEEFVPDSVLPQVAEFVRFTMERNPTAVFPTWAFWFASQA